MMRFLALLMFLSLSLPARAEPQVVDIDMAQMHQATLKQGLVNGPDGYKEKTPDMDRAAELLRPLRFGSWRFSGTGAWGYGGDIYGFIVRDYKFEAETVLNLQDIFNAKYGRPVKIGKFCLPRNKACFFTFDTLRAAWNETLEAFLKDTQDAKINYFDILGEPDLNSFVNVSKEEIYTLLKDAWMLVKKHRPGVKVVLPSNAGFNEKVYGELLAQLARDNLRPDAISWHELGNDPDALIQHVATFRTMLEKYPALCTPDCPEIHINEYQGEDKSLSPGHAVGWLQQLEAAGVSHATRACWGGDAGSPFEYESCWQGFSGLLTPDSQTPQALYWVYRTYADFRGARYAVAALPPKTAVLAGPVETGAEIMVGNYGEAASELRLQLRHFKHAGAEIGLYCLPDTGSKVVPRSDVSMLRGWHVAAEDQMLAIDIGALPAGEACRVTVTPQDAG